MPSLKTNSKNSKILNLAMKNHRAGNFAIADELYRKLRQSDPKNAEIMRLSGLSAGQNGNYGYALKFFAKAISLNPDYTEAFSNRGVIFQKMGKHNEALENFNKALSINPYCAETLNNRGNLFIFLNEPNKALDDLKKAIYINPNFSEAFYNLANVLRDQKHFEVAIKTYSQAIKIKANYFHAYLNRGRTFIDLGDMKNAINDFEKAIDLNDKSPEAFNNKGFVYYELKRYDEAFANFNKAVNLDPCFIGAINNRGLSLLALDKPEKALVDFQKSIEIAPEKPEPYHNLGFAFHKIFKYEKAIDCFSKALNLNHSNPKNIYNNLGATYRALGNYEESLKCYDKSISLDKNYAEAYFGKSLVSLLLGNFSEGLDCYEWRWRTENFTSPKRKFEKPLWDGIADLSGKTILIHWEQGLGDTLQYCRLVKEIKKKNTKIIFEVQRQLYGLIKTLDPDITIVQSGSKLPYFDYFCPLMSLPQILKLTVNNIPAYKKYLEPSASKIHYWEKLLGKRVKPRIGIVWSGSKTHANDENRSINLDNFLTAIPEIFDLVSLQKDIRKEDLETLKNTPVIQNYSELIENFSDTAAVCSLVDIILTVDTSVAHLAGAIGKPVFLLLPLVPDFRWLLEREDTPWYPSMRIFRQKTRGDWKPVFSEIKRILENLNDSSN